MAKKRRKSKYKAPPRKKVGRCWFVCGYNKRFIDGLSWDSGNGYFYYTYFKEDEDYQRTGKRPQFGKDYDVAIMRYRQWREDKAFTHIEIDDGNLRIQSTAVRKRSAEEKAMLEELAEGMSDQEKVELGVKDGIGDTSEANVVDISEGDYQDGYTKIIHNLALTEDIIIAKSKELFATYPPSILAEKYGMPSLAKIDYVDDLKEPHTLKQIGNCYFNKVEFVDPTKEQKRELDKVKKVWKQFCRAVSARTAKELKKDEIRDFYNDIFRERKRKKYSSTWMRGRFERIKRVFNSAIEQLDDIDDVITARGKIGAVLKAPKGDVKEKPYRIPKPHFHTILEHSNTEERCMWLLSMNLAYYSVDVATLPLSAINFEEKTVVFRRGKTGKHRSGVLWQITIDAIRAYQKECPHNGETLFWNFQGKKPYLPNRIRKKFMAVAEKAKLRGEGKKRLTHRNFRDSLKSIGVEKGIRIASVNAAMGHHTVHDEYVDAEVLPKISEEACDAIYEYYFAEEKVE